MPRYDPGMLPNVGRPAAVDRRAGAEVRRVCLMIGQLAAGGAEKQVALLARELRRRGVATSVLLLFRGGGPWEAELVEAGVEVVPLGFGRRDGRWALGANLAVFGRLVGYLRRTRPDVLHAFLFHTYLVAAPAALLARVPAMVAGRRSLGYFKEGRRLMLALEWVANRLTDLVVANAEAVAADARRQEGLPAAKVAVVYNGLPESAFAAAEPAEVSTALPVVLCVANLRAVKGHRHLIDAMARLRYLGRPCTLVLAGDGPEEPALRRQVAELGVDVRFLGTRWDVGRLLARADVAVSPSLSEGMSNAVMEAMAAGRPVVATAVGGTPELLRDRGVLVPPSDPGALADGLHRVLSDPELAGRLARDGYAWSRAHLHVDTMVDRHLALYGGLLAGRGPR
jgi:glycosyltransferase involved in cell wall biosynthesis